MQSVPPDPVTASQAGPVPRPARRHARRWAEAAAVVVSIEVGLLLFTLPWTPFWDHGFWATQWRMSHPLLAQTLLSPYFRGAVSGLGLINLWSGTSQITHLRL